MKSHTKSRRGCVQCKHRKVKCDETLPCCDRCRRRHEHCSYLDEVYGSPGRHSTTREIDNNSSSGNNAPVSATTPGSSSGGSTALGPGSAPAPGPGSGSGPGLPGAHTFTSGPDSASTSGYGHPHNSFNSGPRGPSQVPGRLSMLDTSVTHQNHSHNHGHARNYNHNVYDAPATSRSLSMTQSPAGTPIPPSIPPLSDSANGYVVDMELLHFYLTCTYKTLWGRPEGKLVWRDVIFREALTHPALMNGLLTTAALHRIVTLGQTHGSAAAAVYHSVALHKQRQALEGLVVLLRSLDPDSCRAIFPLSMMVSFWAFVSRDVPEDLGILTTLDVNGGIQPPGPAKSSTNNNNNNSMSNHASPSAMKTEPSTPLPLPHPHSLSHTHHSHHHHQQQQQQQQQQQLAPARSALDLFVELIRRIRAVQTIAQESISWLTQSDFLPLMAVPNYDTLPALPPGITAALHSLDAHIQRTPRIAAMLSGLDSRYSLGSMYQLSRCPDWLELVTGWPMTLPQSFVDELGRRNPAALTVFAYWLGCFQVLEDRWWARGWTAALIVEIEEAVRGGEWAGLVDWVRMYLSIIK